MISKRRRNEMEKDAIIQDLFNFSDDIRYVAIYLEEDLVYEQRDGNLEGASEGGTDRFEELLVNPTILKLATQRGDIDCGGLRYILIRYGNFFQLIRSIPGGHISICLDKNSDLNQLPNSIFDFLKETYPELF